MRYRMLDRQTGAACLDDQAGSFLEGNVISVVLLEQVLRALLVCPDGRGFPAAVVAARVALVQLEPPVLVPAGTQDAPLS